MPPAQSFVHDEYVGFAFHAYVAHLSKLGQVWAVLGLVPAAQFDSDTTVPA